MSSLFVYFNSKISQKIFFFFSSRRRHTRCSRDWSSDVCSSDLDLFTVDVNAPATCDDPGYVPDQLGFGLFGMGFASNGSGDPCAKLYTFSYSGSGPFGEGPGLGRLGVIDPDTAKLTSIGSVDFD